MLFLTLLSMPSLYSYCEDAGNVIDTMGSHLLLEFAEIQNPTDEGGPSEQNSDNLLWLRQSAHGSTQQCPKRKHIGSNSGPVQPM